MVTSEGWPRGFDVPSYGWQAIFYYETSGSDLNQGRCSTLALSIARVDAHNGQRYYPPVILSFASAESERVFRAELSRGFPPDIQRRARRKLLLLHAATELRHLVVPPGNRLEALKGDRKGQHSIRVNDRWRICFRWRNGNAADVEIVDYH